MTEGREPALLSEAELADRCGVDLEQVRRLVSVGILEAEEGGFQRRDVMRARVVAQLETIGIEPEALAAALATGHLTLGYLESAGRRHPRSDRTFRDVADDVGVPVETLQRLHVAFGLPRPEPDELVRQEDADALRVVPVLLAAGLAESDVLRFARVMGDSTRRLAQYIPHYFHATVEATYRRRGLRDNEAYEAAIREIGLRIGRSGEQLLGWLFRRHSEVFTVEHQFEHVETALEDAGVRRRPARRPEAAVFADLTGFTQLTEEAGDEVAAETALSLAQLASEVAAARGGAVVKLLGDGVYLHFDNPEDAVHAALDIVAGTEPRGLPPAHVGVSAGPMLYDEGDYFGRTVNLAARLANRASGGQVYVSEAVAEAVSMAPGAGGISFREVGTVELKGIATAVRILEVSRSTTI